MAQPNARHLPWAQALSLHRRAAEVAVPRTAQDVMTANPVFVTLETPLEDVAKLMVQHGCGEIPVVDSLDSCKPIGVVTDRDIVCRMVARGKNPLAYTAEHCMSQPIVTVTLDTPLAEVVSTMETHQIRRVPVIDERGYCAGMIAQADIAWADEEREVGKLVREVSRDRGTESR
jgi:CBS domain-containing protein